MSSNFSTFFLPPSSCFMPFQDLNFCWGLVALEKYPIDRLTSADLVPYQRQWLEETRFLNIHVCNACISWSNLGHICLNVDHLVGVERCVMVCRNRWLAVTLFSAQQKNICSGDQVHTSFAACRSTRKGYAIFEWASRPLTIHHARQYLSVSSVLTLKIYTSQKPCLLD